MDKFITVSSDGRVTRVYNMDNLVFAEAVNDHQTRLHMSDNRDYLVELSLDRVRGVLQ